MGTGTTVIKSMQRWAQDRVIHEERERPLCYHIDDNT